LFAWSWELEHPQQLFLRILLKLVFSTAAIPSLFCCKAGGMIKIIGFGRRTRSPVIGMEVF
jgi:hypothetical protein